MAPAALDTKPGEVLGQTMPRHTSAASVQFLQEIVTSQQTRREIHVNYQVELWSLQTTSSSTGTPPGVHQRQSAEQTRTAACGSAAATKRSTLKPATAR